MVSKHGMCLPKKTKAKKNMTVSKHRAYFIHCFEVWATLCKYMPQKSKINKYKHTHTIYIYIYIIYIYIHTPLYCITSSMGSAVHFLKPPVDPVSSVQRLMTCGMRNSENRSSSSSGGIWLPMAPSRDQLSVPTGIASGCEH